MEDEQKKKTLKYFFEMMKKKEKLTWITSYNAPVANLAEKAGIDMILVGDSAGNNELGYESTIPVTMDEMIMVSKAVRRGAPNTFIIGDMPLGSYQASNSDAIYNALRFIKEAGMDAVKCEGGIRMAERVKAMNDAGIGVLGHIGYTPQSTNLEGIVQSKNLDKFKSLLEDAKALGQAGAWGILLEAVPNEPAGLITEYMNQLQKPVLIYGIGAGSKTNGVLAIVNDVIGLGDFKCKFAKPYCQANSVLFNAIKEYIKEVKETKFPSEKHFYEIKQENLQEIKDYWNNLDEIKKG